MWTGRHLLAIRVLVCWLSSCFIPNIFDNMIHNCSDKVTASTPTYRRICNFYMFLHFTVLLPIYFNTLYTYSLIMSNDKCLILAIRRTEHGPNRRLLPGTSATSIYTSYFENPAVHYLYYLASYTLAVFW